jgi:hypothetical protein
MQRPAGIGAFQFVILASLRASQLMRGCLPRIEGEHKNTVIAQLEVAQGMVLQDFGVPDDVVVPASVIATAPPPVVAAVEVA